MSDFHKQKELNKGKKTYVLTQKQITDMKRECVKIAVRRAFAYALGITCEILIHEHWSKTARRVMPKFVRECMSLFEAVERELVSVDELLADVEDVSGVNLEEFKVVE